MTPALVVAVVAASLGLAAWSGVLGARDAVPGRRFLQAMFGLQGLLVAQLAVVLFFVSDDERPAETSAFIAYLVLSLFLVPGSFALALEEKTRWGTLVLTIACLAVAVVEWRLVATWS